MMQPQKFAEALEQLCPLGPYPDVDAAKRGFSSVLRALAQGLTRDERLALADDLPAEEAQVLRGGAEIASSDLESMIRAIADAEQVGTGIAREHLQVVGRALMQMLSARGRALLTRAVPDLAPLLEPVAAAEANLARHELPEVGLHDLAEGHEGGRHPLASSNPAQLAHRHSIARSDDPHADTKLSSTSGLAQEREGTSLATGRPGSRRPLSTGH
jgi:hypothetical protein